MCLKSDDPSHCHFQLLPELFSALHSVIDDNRRPGRFILLGPASQNLIQKTSESFAGRVGLIGLSPFTIKEVEAEPVFDLNKFWLRGGYPDSYLASSDQGSVLWRENFIRTYVERDIPQLGFQIPVGLDYSLRVSPGPDQDSFVAIPSWDLLSRSERRSRESSAYSDPAFIIVCQGCCQGYLSGLQSRQVVIFRDSCIFIIKFHMI